ncbi:MAG: DUF3465 domain-containing protein, partial [Gammaproteobacteria bacterium]
MNKYILVLLLLINHPALSDTSEFDAGTGALYIPTVIIGNGLVYDAKLQFNSDGLFSIISFKTSNEHTDAAPPLMISGSGKVDRILADDNIGSRHQRFILKLASGQTVLIAHNIDIAPRINSLALNDVVDFHGEYVWNSQGGLVHWTHHDPDGSHESGWLIHNNT